MSKVRDIDEALALIGDGATVVVCGTGAVLEPDLILERLEEKFLKDGHPRDLTVVSPMLPGDRPGEGGLNCFAHEGMTARIIGAAFTRHRHPRLIELIRNDGCEAYIIPMAAAVQLMTAIGSRKPGVFTPVGLHTYVDPRQEGGCMNERSKSPPVRLERIDGKEYLYYPAFPIDAAILRGTTADENGYVGLEEETNSLGVVEMALAARNSGGKVIVQVKRVARAGSLDPRLVRIPGPLVDAVVVNPFQYQVSPRMADPRAGWNPFLSGALKASYAGIPPVEAGPNRVILRRAALELQPGDVVNLGVGAATHLPRIALEEDILDRVVFTNEHGIFGGLMATATGGSFVPALNAEAIMDALFQFNYYDGGGLDIAFLGIGEADAAGNLNVSKFGQEITGPGGFISITDRTPRLVFCGTLTSGGFKAEVANGAIRIVREGKHRKFVPQVEQVTFNAREACAKGQSVLYVTERAVFRLGERGLELAEVAPGIDIDRDIRPQVGFELKMPESLGAFPAEVFADEPMGLRRKFEDDPARSAARNPDHLLHTGRTV
jgi:acyl CoA:acetate/3-ketoacid CoA transferase